MYIYICVNSQKITYIYFLKVLEINVSIKIDMRIYIYIRICTYSKTFTHI